MKNKSLSNLLKDNLEYRNFISKKLGIEEDFKIIRNSLPNCSDSIAYSLGNNNIWISNKMKRMMYFILENKNLNELEEGCKFIIYHELGHSHGINYKNKNVNDYFYKLLEISKDYYSITKTFPESEATRYALSKSKNYIEAIAGITAISSFIYKNEVNEALESFSSYFSNSAINDKKKRDPVNAISNFKLSSENMEKIKSKIEQYLKKLDSLFKTSILYGVKRKY